MSSNPLEKKKQMPKVSLIAGLIWPEKKRQYKEWLISESERAVLNAEELAKTDAPSQKLRDAIRYAKRRLVETKKLVNE